MAKSPTRPQDAATAYPPAAAAHITAGAEVPAAGTTNEAAAEHRAEMVHSAVTAAAPSTQPAAAVHDRQPIAVLGVSGDALDLIQERRATQRLITAPLAEGLPGHAAPLSPQADRFVEAVRAERKPADHGIVSRLLDHPDTVVQAKAREAIASLDADAADAGILSRAAVDTARELDRGRGTLGYIPQALPGVRRI